MNVGKILVIFTILFLTGVFAYNSGFNTPFNDAKNFGIEGSNVMVSVRGENMSLQEALDKGWLGTCNPDFISRPEEIVDFVFPDEWHSGYDIDIQVPEVYGGAISLQEAIHGGYLGGGIYSSEYIPKENIYAYGHSADEVTIKINGEDKTLQQAVNEKILSKTSCSCGDFVVDKNEACDLGNANSDSIPQGYEDGCSTDCKQVILSRYKVFNVINELYGQGIITTKGTMIGLSDYDNFRDANGGANLVCSTIGGKYNMHHGTKSVIIYANKLPCYSDNKQYFAAKHNNIWGSGELKCISIGNYINYGDKIYVEVDCARY